MGNDDLVAVMHSDAATGTGYIMFSAENIFTRFAAHPPYAYNSEHLITVKYVNNQWWAYDTNAAYYAFTPVATDLLIAAVDFDANTISLLEGVEGQVGGIALGYYAGDLTARADWLNGVSDPADFTVYGTYFLRNADAARTTQTYDALGRRLTLTDPEENTTAWTYDGLGRMIEEISPLPLGEGQGEGFATRYFSYNAAGLLVEKTDRNGRVTRYEYDNLYRLKEENWLDESEQVVYTIAYTYDALGRVLSASDAAATYEYEYDALGRVLTETQTLADLTPVIVFAYQYNANSQRTQSASTIGGIADAVTDYFYDSLGRLTCIQQHGATGGNAVAEKRVDFSYDAASKYATIAYYSDLDGGVGDLVMTATYGYDPLGRLTDLVYTDASEDTIREFEWMYDAASRIIGHDSDVDTEDVAAGQYTYDDTNQLTGANYTDAGRDDESFVYDDNGNRIEANGDNYTTGANNQTTGDGTFRYEYDAEGNLLFRYVDEDTDGELDSGDTDITQFTWDQHNRLTEVAHKAVFGGSIDWKADYIYDCFNHRIASLYDNNGDSAVDREERYVWQGKNAVLDFIDADGAGETYSLDLARRYLWGAAVDQLLAQEAVDDGSADDALYFVRDNLGSTRSLVDYLGEITATYSYDTFGTVTVLLGSITDTRYQFTCQEYDIYTAFYYYDARWYDPTLGKFISLDPAEDDINLYRYCGNQPLTNVDPRGLDCIQYKNENGMDIMIEFTPAKDNMRYRDDGIISAIRINLGGGEYDWFNVPPNAKLTKGPCPSLIEPSKPPAPPRPPKPTPSCKPQPKPVPQPAPTPCKTCPMGCNKQKEITPAGGEGKEYCIPQKLINPPAWMEQFEKAFHCAYCNFTNPGFGMEPCEICCEMEFGDSSTALTACKAACMFWDPNKKR